MHRELDEDGAGMEALGLAMDRLADFPVGPEHAIVLLTYGETLWELGRVEDARRSLERARVACELNVPETEELAALCLLAWISFDSGDLSTGMQELDQVAALLGRGDDHPARPALASERTQILLVLGRLEDAVAAARHGLEIARRYGLEQSATAQLLRCDLFEALVERGRHAEAESVLRVATQWAPTSGASYDHMTMASLDMLGDDLDAATSRWAAIEAVTHPKNLEYGGNLVDRGVIDLWAGRPHAALDRIKCAMPRVGELSYRRFTAEILSTAMRACADIGEAARAHRDGAGEHAARMSAEDLVNAHAAMRPDPFAAHPFYVTAGAHGATWAAELTRVAGTPDPHGWAAAAAAWTELQRPHRAAYARWRQAGALLVGGRVSEAGDCLRDAAVAAHNHAPLLSEIRSLAGLARLDLPGEDSGSTEPTPYALTPREAAVLRLLAEGLTNTEIGNRLFISNKTASVHVTHILNKLGVRNRTQAAAVAQRAGLVGTDRDGNVR